MRDSTPLGIKLLDSNMVLNKEDASNLIKFKNIGGVLGDMWN